MTQERFLLKRLLSSGAAVALVLVEMGGSAAQLPSCHGGME